jgi:hypothetical protein
MIHWFKNFQMKYFFLAKIQLDGQSSIIFNHAKVA